MSSSDTEYEIEAIIGKRTKKNITQYKVRWLGYDDDVATWENGSDLNCSELINEFEKNGVKPPFVVDKIIESKYYPDSDEIVYTCLNRHQQVKELPSSYFKRKCKQVLIDYLQDNVECTNEHEPKLSKTKKSKKSEIEETPKKSDE